MAKAAKKKTKPKQKQSPINGSFDDVISASVRDIGHPTKKDKKAKK